MLIIIVDTDNYDNPNKHANYDNSDNQVNNRKYI